MAERSEKVLLRFVETVEDFDALLRAGPTVAVFSASWCSPCRRLLPLFQELAALYREKGAFLKISQEQEDLLPLFDQLQIASIPTVLFFREGKVVDSLVGANPEALRLLCAKFFR